MKKKIVKSQFELYLEQLEFNGDEHEALMDDILTAQKGIDEQSTSSKFECFLFILQRTLHKVLYGIVDDIWWVFEAISGKSCFHFARYNKSISTPGDILRRSTVWIISLILLYSYLIYTFKNILIYLALACDNGITLWYNYELTMNRIKLFIAATFLLVPICLSLLLSYLFKKVSVNIIISRQYVERIVSAVKRVQLVHMGGSITHPLPPVAKLEGRILHHHCVSSTSNTSDENKQYADHNNALAAKDIRIQLGESIVCLGDRLDALVRYSWETDTVGIGEGRRRREAQRTRTDSVRSRSGSSSDCNLVDALEQQRSIIDRYVQTHRSSSCLLPPSLSSIDTLSRTVLHHTIDTWIAYILIHNNSNDSTTSGSSNSYVDDYTAQQDQVHAIKRRSNCTIYCNMFIYVLQAITHIILIIWQLYQFSACLEVFITDCKKISWSTLPSPPLPLSANTVEVCIENKTTQSHQYSDLYLTLRADLLRLRGKYEEMVIRLWSVEQQLCTPEALQYTLSDDDIITISTGATTTGSGATNNSTNSTTAAATEKCILKQHYIHNLLFAQQILAGNSSHTTLPSMEAVETTAALVCTEAMDAMEAQLAVLPSLREYESWLTKLNELILATNAGIIPERRQLVHGSAQIADSTAVAEVVGSLDRIDGSLPAEKTMNSSQQPEAFGDCEETLDDTVQSQKSAQLPQDHNIVDVYTTTVPRYRPLTVPTAIAQVDPGLVARERASARSMLRELRQHLHMLQVPVVDTSQQNSSTLASTAGTTGRGVGSRRRERVRELLSSEDDHDSANLRMETSIHDIPSQNPIELTGYDSEDDNQHITGISRNTALKNGDLKSAAGSIRVGTILLTEQELQHASCLTNHDIEESENMRSAFMQELLQSQKEAATGSAAAVSSTFALALQARRQEASFGDELSD